MTPTEAMEALREYRRSMLMAVGRGLVSIAAEDCDEDDVRYTQGCMKRLRTVNEIMKREDLIRGALERLK